MLSEDLFFRVWVRDSCEDEGGFLKLLFDVYVSYNAIPISYNAARSRFTTINVDIS